MDRDSSEHLFPNKKFLKSKSRKEKGLGSSGWSASVKIARDDSEGEHLRIEPATIELYSAKLVRSYIREK